MKLLIISCIPDPDARSRYQFDFTHDTTSKQILEAAFLVINILSHYTKDFYFTLVETDNTGNIPNCDVWINNGLASLSSLKRNFTPDVWKEILDLAYEIAQNEHRDKTLADNIKEYRIFVI